MQSKSCKILLLTEKVKSFRRRVDISSNFILFIVKSLKAVNSIHIFLRSFHVTTVNFSMPKHETENDGGLTTFESVFKSLKNNIKTT